MGRYAFGALAVGLALVAGILGAEAAGVHPVFGTLAAALLFQMLRAVGTRVASVWGRFRLSSMTGLRGPERRRLASILEMLDRGHPDVVRASLDSLARRIDGTPALDLARARASLRLVTHRRFGKGRPEVWAGVTGDRRHPVPHLERALLAPALQADDAMVAAQAATVDDAALASILRHRDLLCAGLLDGVGRPWKPLFRRGEEDLLYMLGSSFVLMPRPRLRALARSLQPRRRLPAREEAALLLMAFDREQAAAALLAAGDAAGSLSRRGRAILSAALMLRFLRDDSTVLVSPEDFARRTRTLFFLHTREFAMTDGSAHLEVLANGAERLLQLLREKRSLVEVLAVLWARRPALGRVLSPIIRRVASGSGESRVPHSAARFLRWWRDGGRGVDEACAYNLRGLCILDESRPAEAEAEFERALELDPWFAAAAFNLAVARDRSDAPGDPAEPLRRVATASSDNAEGWLLLGEFLERVERTEEAEEVVRRVLRVEPMHAQACLTLGRLLMSAGRMDEAEEALQRAVAAAAGHPDALINLALVHLESGRPAEAVPLLRTAVEVSDGNRREEARYLLHVAFRDADQHDRALEVLDEVPDRFLRRHEHLMEQAAGYLEERRRFDRSQKLWERLREMRARRGEL